ncbi:MAG: heat-inducible transcriptional repressor HrcA [Chloroflexota bacterium]|nr:heat-inducible transcriptional repressor HrcA [Aggregatilineaceae bacterium]
MSDPDPSRSTLPNPLDSGTLPALSERQEAILSLVVREYIRQAQPVASKTLADAFELGVSSATIRNEMAVLEEHGLIYAPHTSAGRVPTQKGYRYFVQRLLTDADLPPADRRRIAQAFREVPLNLEEWMRMAAMVLARTAQAPAVVTSPRAAEHRFKHLELINTQGRLVLMVLVLDGGSVHQQLLTLAEPVPQRVLSQTAQIMNLACAHRTAEAVRAITRKESTELARDIGELVADAMLQADQHGPRDVYRYGLSESLTSFTDDEAQQAVRILEEQSLLNGILQEALAGDESEIRVVVAGEGRWEALSHLSMVLGRYGTPQAYGALGLLGPTRMRYGRAVSAVRYVAGLMSGLLDNVYGEPKES